MDIQDFCIYTEPASGSEPPVELVLAQQKLLKLNMYAYYSPRSAQYLRECIAYELERAERILMERIGGQDVDRHRNAIEAARKALAVQNA